MEHEYMQSFITLLTMRNTPFFSMASKEKFLLECADKLDLLDGSIHQPKNQEALYKMAKEYISSCFTDSTYSTGILNFRKLQPHTIRKKIECDINFATAELPATLHQDEIFRPLREAFENVLAQWDWKE